MFHLILRTGQVNERYEQQNQAGTSNQPVIRINEKFFEHNCLFLNFCSYQRDILSNLVEAANTESLPSLLDFFHVGYDCKTKVSPGIRCPLIIFLSLRYNDKIDVQLLKGTDHDR
jgi:hypothetical protein